MTEVRFYHLQKQTLDDALPMILEKARQAEFKVVVQLSDKGEVDRMNKHLWSYKPDSFLTHGSYKEGFEAEQPIWLTASDENLNNANALILTQGVVREDISSYDLCCEMLDGRNSDAVAQARARWKVYKETGYEVTYWYQDDAGKWDKKA